MLGIGGAFTAGPDMVGCCGSESHDFYIAAAHGYDPEHPMRPPAAGAAGVYQTPGGAGGTRRLGKLMAQAMVEKASPDAAWRASKCGSSST